MRFQESCVNKNNYHVERHLLYVHTNLKINIKNLHLKLKLKGSYISVTLPIARKAKT